VKDMELGPAVPFRRWEDWERSRLRKLKREERRRRDFERSHPGGYLTGEGDLLGTRISQYDGSDTLSLASSDEDHWGTQIGGYNEYNAKYPPPPVGLHIPHDTLRAAKTVGGAELEAMLETGFDDDGASTPPGPPRTTRYALTDASTTQLLHGYNPVSQYAPQGQMSHSSGPLSPTTPTLNMNGSGHDAQWGGQGRGGPTRTPPSRPPRQQYGPLGPLDPGARF